MSKTLLPFVVGDISAFASSLRRQLDALERVPGHVEMLNLVVKAGGFRNFQHFRAQQQTHAALNTPRPVPAEINYKLVRQLVRFFDAQGRLIRWPKKFTHRILCLWALWARIPARTDFTERQVCDQLETLHLFGDHALLRRELVDRGMMTRTSDCTRYRRLEVRPPAEAVALLEHLRN